MINLQALIVAFCIWAIVLCPIRVLLVGFLKEKNYKKAFSDYGLMLLGGLSFLGTVIIGLNLY